MLVYVINYMGYLGRKARSQELKIEKKKLVNTLVATVFIQISCKLVRKFILIISMSSSNMGHLGSKTRSHCQNM
jgi:hypothetical protein